MSERKLSSPESIVILYDDCVLVANTCPVCRQRHDLRVETDKWMRWRDPASSRCHVQDFWQELTPAEREEFFISGVCGCCWKKLFGCDV